MAKILIIEDDPFLLEIYTSKFEEAGFDVNTAKNGELALSAIKEAVPDVILLDIVMPKMDGYELLRELKKEKLDKKMKIVLLTNLGQKEEVEKGLKLGADDYVIKAHFTPTEVVAKVKSLLGK